MVSFPILQHLRVRGYGMYPGGRSKDGLDIGLKAGLTLVLGANGLGKTTLVTMLYRLCAGTYDIPGLARGGELGTRSIEATEVGPHTKRVFAVRVTDDAADATATLRFGLGDARFEVTRSLRNLAVRSLSVDGVEQPASEEAYHELVLEHAGLSTFGDWILVLRHITFYFEDRRALVWDPSAQRQLLRILFLPAQTASQWSTLERDILERDTRMRNLQAALSREEVAIKQVEDSVGGASDVREQLQILQDLQAIDLPRVDDLNERLTELEAQRQQLRLAALRAELDNEHAYRNLERLQLRAIDDAFPSDDATAKYLFAKLFANDACLACGHVAPKTAEQLRRRLDTRHCVVCGSKLDASRKVKPLAPRAIAHATKKLGTARDVFATARAVQAEAEAEFEAHIAQVQELNATVAARDATIESLVKRLPPADADLIEQRSDLASLRARVEVQRAEIAQLRAEFGNFIRRVNRDIASRKEAVQHTFADFAAGFLLERCSLLWATHKSPIGQSGQQIDFPSFELEMSGADPSPVLRSGPDQVSESQREFIDLAFRMTLMAVAGSEGAGSLVIDAPESSLDAVFVKRAADVLTKFADPAGPNRLVVTSNLIEGDLIPEMMNKAGVKSARDGRIVDLLRLAAPTAATKALGADYAAVRERLFRRARRHDG